MQGHHGNMVPFCVLTYGKDNWLTTDKGKGMFQVDDVVQVANPYSTFNNMYGIIVEVVEGEELGITVELGVTVTYFHEWELKMAGEE